MSRYSGAVRSITPSTSDDNWTLDAASGESGKVQEVSFGGEATTSTAMHTRTARSGSESGAGTAGNVAKLHPNAATNLIAFNTTYATTQPTLDAGDLFTMSWNAHGGVIRWLAAPGEEFVLIGAALISNRNSVGTATSSYGVIWEED